MHRVPEGFIWPSYVVSTMWNLWFLGDSQRNIGSYRFISAKTDLTTGRCKTNRSRTAKVFRRMIDILTMAGSIAKEKDITHMNIQSLFEYSYERFLGEIYAVYPTRPNDININTLANRMKS